MPSEVSLSSVYISLAVWIILTPKTVIEPYQKHLDYSDNSSH
jgi:hypothetical protein